jgi:hypothetical protein
MRTHQVREQQEKHAATAGDESEQSGQAPQNFAYP